jgi:hypothetical protein
MHNYGFGEDQVKSSVNPFPVGDNVDNVEITDAKYSCSENDTWESIDITYTRNGTSITDRMFAVNPDNVQPRPYKENDTVEDATADRIKILNTQLYHVASKLGVTKAQLQGCDTSSFEALATDYCKLVNANCKGVKLWAKTIRDAKGYVKMARYTGNTTPYLQRMDDGDCQLAYTQKEVANMNSTPANGIVGKAPASTADYMPQRKV